MSLMNQTQNKILTFFHIFVCAFFNTENTELHIAAEPQPKRLLDADQYRFTKIYISVNLRYLRTKTLLKKRSFPSLYHKELFRTPRDKIHSVTLLALCVSVLKSFCVLGCPRILQKLELLNNLIL